MEVIIQSLGFKHSHHLETFIREKLEKLTPSDHIVRANVTLHQEEESSTANDYCEIRLEVPGNDIFVKENSAVYEEAINECINMAQGILRKQKDKEVDGYKRGSL